MGQTTTAELMAAAERAAAVASGWRGALSAATRASHATELARLANVAAATDDETEGAAETPAQAARARAEGVAEEARAEARAARREALAGEESP